MLKEIRHTFYTVIALKTKDYSTINRLFHLKSDVPFHKHWCMNNSHLNLQMTCGKKLESPSAGPGCFSFLDHPKYEYDGTCGLLFYETSIVCQIWLKIGFTARSITDLC